MITFQVIKNFFKYLGGISVSKATFFILLPLFTRELTQGEYGSLELIIIFINFFSIVISMGFPQYLAIEYFHHEGLERKKVIAQTIYSYIYLATPIVLIISLFTPLIQQLFFNKQIPYHLILLALCISYTSYFSLTIVSLLRVKQQATKVVLIEVTTGVIALGMNVLFLLYFHYGITGIVIVRIFTPILIISLGYFIFDFTGVLNWKKINAQTVTERIKVGAPLVVSTFFSILMTSSDRWIMSYYSTNEGIGIYSLAYRFASLFGIVILTALSSAYSPYMFSLFQSIGLRNAEQKNSKFMLLYSLTLCPLAAISVLLLKPLFYWVIGSEFHNAYQFILPLMVSYFFLGIMNMCGMSIMFKKKTNYIFISFFVGAFSNIAMNFYAIPKYDIWGATITTVISYFLVMLLLIFYRHKILHQ